MDAFVLNWAARYGVPHTATTFTLAVWSCLCRTLGIRHILTTAYHPQNNDMALFSGGLAARWFCLTKLSRGGSLAGYYACLCPARSGPRDNSYSGPYRVVKRKSKILLLQLGDRQEWVSADRLKPHTGESLVAADPPRQGRPLGWPM